MKGAQTGKGFTLIEMLVVIVIMLILTGIVLRLITFVGERDKRSRAIYELEQIQNALTAYFTEYGIYPPVSAMKYEYECQTNQPVRFQTFLRMHNDPGDPANFYSDIAGRPDGELGHADHRDWGLGYSYGLTAYLDHRARGQPHWYDSDTARDVAAKDRWQHYIDGIVPNSGSAQKREVPPDVFRAMVTYSNSVDTANDPWGREYQYRCPPPHNRFQLWSMGPDTGRTNDDIRLDRWSE